MRRNLSAAIARLTPLREEELKAAIDADAEAYNAVMKAYKQSKIDTANADALIEASLKLATGVPLGVAEKVHELAAIARSLEPITNPNMKSDLIDSSPRPRPSGDHWRAGQRGDQLGVAERRSLHRRGAQACASPGALTLTR